MAGQDEREREKESRRESSVCVWREMKRCWRWREMKKRDESFQNYKKKEVCI